MPAVNNTHPDTQPDTRFHCGWRHSQLKLKEFLKNFHDLLGMICDCFITFKSFLAAIIFALMIILLADAGATFLQPGDDYGSPPLMLLELWQPSSAARKVNGTTPWMQACVEAARRGPSRALVDWSHYNTDRSFLSTTPYSVFPAGLWAAFAIGHPVFEWSTGNSREVPSFWWLANLSVGYQVDVAVCYLIRCWSLTIASYIISFCLTFIALPVSQFFHIWRMDRVGLVCIGLGDFAALRLTSAHTLSAVLAVSNVWKIGQVIRGRQRLEQALDAYRVFSVALPGPFWVWWTTQHLLVDIPGFLAILELSETHQPIWLAATWCCLSGCGIFVCLWYILSEESCYFEAQKWTLRIMGLKCALQFFTVYWRLDELRYDLSWPLFSCLVPFLDSILASEKLMSTAGRRRTDVDS